MAVTIYSGPGKVYLGATALWPEGENGGINMVVAQAIDEVSTGVDGRVASTQADCVVKVSLTPFDNWGALGVLFPSYIKTPVPGTRPGGSVTLWSPTETRSYVIPNAAITRHPDLHLGVGKALFGGIEITGFLAGTKKLGDAAAFYTITESGASDPGGQMTMADFVREEWTGVWGTATGFGGHTGDSPIEAEDEWTITCAAKYTQLLASKLTRAVKLDTVAFMAKVRPFGPTHSNIDAVIGVNAGRLLGERFGFPGNTGSAIDLVLTGAVSGKTITLKNCDVVGAGFEFGGTRLNTGEIGFVNQMTFTAGVRQPLIVFSS